MTPTLLIWETERMGKNEGRTTLGGQGGKRQFWWELVKCELLLRLSSRLKLAAGQMGLEIYRADQAGEMIWGVIVMSVTCKALSLDEITWGQSSLETQKRLETEYRFTFNSGRWGIKENGLWARKATRTAWGAESQDMEMFQGGSQLG